MSDVGIILQPTKSAASSAEFSSTKLPVFLRCGCVLSVSEVESNTNESGFVFCPVCEYAYTVKSKAKLLTDNKILVPDHIKAQEKRCAFFQGDIQRLEQELDHWVIEEEIEYAEGEDKLLFIADSDPSSVSDESDVEVDDFLDFKSTLYALYQTRLQSLKERRDELAARKKDTLFAGETIQAPWATDAKWKFPVESSEAAQIAAREARRAKRREERKERYASRQARRGSKKVVHNVHVLDKCVPRKWRDTNPNSTPDADFELKAREKQGWLTEQEQEDMDEDEQTSLTEKRREEWRSKQSRVPKIFGSVKRQRWAARLYQISRRRHYFAERMAEITDAAKVSKWKVLLAKHEARLTMTQRKCEARKAKLESTGRYEAAATLGAIFKKAEDIGVKEIEDEIEYRRLAEEAARLKAEAEAEAKEKAEAKAKARAEAEAKGETYVDPDEANEGDEGDEDE